MKVGEISYAWSPVTNQTNDAYIVEGYTFSVFADVGGRDVAVRKYVDFHSYGYANVRMQIMRSAWAEFGVALGAVIRGEGFE